VRQAQIRAAPLPLSGAFYAPIERKSPPGAFSCPSRLFLLEDSLERVLIEKLLEPIDEEAA
jgi:hypothetical protein